MTISALHQLSMLAQLRKDRDQFAFYATNHRAKTGDPMLTQAAREDAETKAIANETMFAEIDALLKSIDDQVPPSGVEMCEDEGCPHHGTAHIHTAKPKPAEAVRSSDNSRENAFDPEKGTWDRLQEPEAQARRDAESERRVELIGTLRQAHDQILTLQQQVESLAPKAHAYDTIAQLARMSMHEPPVGYGVDVRWRLKAAIEQLIAERQAGGPKVS